jgi:hypothetical protein
VIRISLLAGVISMTSLSALAASECGKYVDISDERYSGTIKSINPQNGDGIVAAPSRDYPLVLEDLEKAGIDQKSLSAGAKVTFQVQFDKICRAYRAVNLRLE